MSARVYWGYTAFRISTVMQSFLRLVDKRHVTKYTLFHDQILR